MLAVLGMCLMLPSGAQGREANYKRFGWSPAHPPWDSTQGRRDGSGLSSTLFQALQHLVVSEYVSSPISDISAIEANLDSSIG